MEDDDDSDYGSSKKKNRKIVKKSRPERKEKKMPKPRLKATGKACESKTTFLPLNVLRTKLLNTDCSWLRIRHWPGIWKKYKKSKRLSHLPLVPSRLLGAGEMAC